MKTYPLFSPLLKNTLFRAFSSLPLLLLPLSLGVCNQAKAQKAEEAQEDKGNASPSSKWTTYFVGDLSFALEDYWDEIASIHKNNEFTKFKLKNKEGMEYDVFLFSVDGDGTYTSTKNEKVSTDSGTIGAVPIEFWGKQYPEEVDTMGIVRKLDPNNIKLLTNAIVLDEIVFERE